MSRACRPRVPCATPFPRCHPARLRGPTHLPIPLHCAAFPRRSCSAARSPAGAPPTSPSLFTAPPSLVARSSLLSPGDTAPLRLAHALPARAPLCDHWNGMQWSVRGPSLTDHLVRVEGGTAVTMQPPGSLAAGDIDLSDTAFWGWPAADRQAAFAVLRAREHPAFFAEPEAPFAERGPGYFALVRHADVTEASRNPEVFCSRRGATSILDLPAEFNEYFGSMINMDDPRHARLRRIVSRAFTPRMIGKFEEDVARVATRVVDDLLETGPCDFVENV